MPTLIAVLQENDSNIKFVYYSWLNTGRGVAPIGRAAYPGLHIQADETVSRLHGRVVEDRGEFFLEGNDQAKNEIEVQQLGAWVPLSCAINDQGRYPLADGEFLLFGKTHIQFLSDSIDETSDEYAEARKQMILRNARTLNRVPRRDLGSTMPAGPFETGDD
jgi:hypothetical protein